MQKIRKPGKLEDELVKEKAMGKIIGSTGDSCDMLANDDIYKPGYNINREQADVTTWRHQSIACSIKKTGTKYSFIYSRT